MSVLTVTTRPPIVDIMMARPGVMKSNAPATPPATAHERDATELARKMATQLDLRGAIFALQHGVAQLTASPDVMCIVRLPTGSLTAPDGRAINEGVRSIVSQVIATGHRELLGRAVIEPVGARGALVLRRTVAYSSHDIALLAAIAAAAAPVIEGLQDQPPEARRAEVRAAAAPSKRSRWQLRTLVGTVISASAVALALTAACAKDHGAAHSPHPQAVASTGPLIGVVAARASEVVIARAAGRIARIAVETGQRVHAGDPLVELTHTVGNGTRFELARVQLTAPIEGVVSLLDAEPGEVVAPGATIARVFDPANLLVRFQVPRERRADIAAGTTVELQIAGTDRVVHGRVKSVSTSAELPTDFAVAEADIFDDAAARAITIGMIGNVRVSEAVAAK